MEILQQILYSIFGIMTIIGGLTYSNTSLMFIIKSGFRKEAYKTDSKILLIGLIGLLLTYIWF